MESTTRYSYSEIGHLVYQPESGDLLILNTDTDGDWLIQKMEEVKVWYPSESNEYGLFGYV